MTREGEGSAASTDIIKSALGIAMIQGVPLLIECSMKKVAATATTICHALNIFYVPIPVFVRVQTTFASG